MAGLKAVILCLVLTNFFMWPLVFCDSTCPAGSYSNPEGNCVPCSEVNNPAIETVVSECTSVQDTVTECVDGYHRTPAISAHERGMCVKCGPCNDTHPYPIKPCKGNKNTICCPGINYEVQEDKDGIGRCVQFCGRGEYLDTQTDTCQPCGDNSYMTLEKHRNEECIPCRESQNFQIQTSPCNRTHPTGLGCREGFFATPSETKYDPKCNPCQDCQYNNTHPYLGQNCTSIHDTVCCPLPNMTVVSASGGFDCRSKVIQPETSTPARTEDSSSPAPTSEELENTSSDTYSHSQNGRDSAESSTPKYEDHQKDSIDTGGIFAVAVSILALLVVPMSLVFLRIYGYKLAN